jgi:hypothetical protein
MCREESEREAYVHRALIRRRLKHITKAKRSVAGLQHYESIKYKLTHYVKQSVSRHLRSGSSSPAPKGNIGAHFLSNDLGVLQLYPRLVHEL